MFLSISCVSKNGKSGDFLGNYREEKNQLYTREMHRGLLCKSSQRSLGMQRTSYALTAPHEYQGRTLAAQHCPTF